MGIETLRHGDQIDGIEATAANQHALAAAKIDGGLVETLAPGVLMPVGKEEEQPLHLHAAAIGKKLLQAAGAEIVVPSSPVAKML